MLAKTDCWTIIWCTPSVCAITVLSDRLVLENLHYARCSFTLNMKSVFHFSTSALSLAVQASAWEKPYIYLQFVIDGHF